MGTGERGTAEESQRQVQTGDGPKNMADQPVPANLCVGDAEGGGEVSKFGRINHDGVPRTQP